MYIHIWHGPNEKYCQYFLTLVDSASDQQLGDSSSDPGKWHIQLFIRYLYIGENIVTLYIVCTFIFYRCNYTIVVKYSVVQLNEIV